MLSSSSSAGICCPDHISTLIRDAAKVFSGIDSLDARIGPSTDMLSVRRQNVCLRPSRNRIMTMGFTRRDAADVQKAFLLHVRTRIQARVQ